MQSPEYRQSVIEESENKMAVSCPEKEDFIKPETLEELANGFELLGLKNWQLPKVTIKFIEPRAGFSIAQTAVTEDEVNVIYDRRFITENEEDNNSLVSQLGGTDFPGVQQIIKHELAHIALWSVTKQDRQPAIRLLDEGWASLIEHASSKNINNIEELVKQVKQDVLDGLRNDEKNYYKCLDFNNPPSQYKNENSSGAEYVVGRTFLLWIRENYGGNESMIELLKNSPEAHIRNDKRDEFNEQFPKDTIVNLTKEEAEKKKIQWEQKRFKEAVLEITGLSSIDEVNQEFKNWLDKK